MHNKADQYFKETVASILNEGTLDENPRPKYKDGEKAYSKFITQQFYQYDISKGEFPITTLRTTPLKAAFHDIEAIYIKQTNIVEEMHSSIHSWWQDFSCEKNDWKDNKKKFDFKMPSSGFNMWEIIQENYEDKDYQSLGQTYGHTVKRYDLMNKLLKGLEESPYSRRHSINLNQEQQKIDDPQALQCCAFETLWSVRGKYIDLTLIQRSQDSVVTFSINPAQYLMLALIVCNHLKFKTGIDYKIGKFCHLVNNSHVYLRHLEQAKEILFNESLGQPEIKLICEPKDFYNHTVEDFEFILPAGIPKLTEKLEIAI